MYFQSYPDLISMSYCHFSLKFRAFHKFAQKIKILDISQMNVFYHFKSSITCLDMCYIGKVMRTFAPQNPKDKHIYIAQVVHALFAKILISFLWLHMNENS